MSIIVKPLQIAVMQKQMLLLLILGWSFIVSAQNTVTSNGVNVFKYPNGNVASEGMMQIGRAHV